ncbi:MAG: AAA family ATPase [Christensenellales bacterium]
MLLVGPPGTGKTLLAKAVAGEAGAPLMSICRFGLLWKCLPAWAQAACAICLTRRRKHAPCIVFYR